MEISCDSFDGTSFGLCASEIEEVFQPMRRRAPGSSTQIDRIYLTSSAGSKMNPKKGAPLSPAGLARSRGRTRLSPKR